MKKQKIKQIKFRQQYLYIVKELIENALFFKKDYKNICLIDTGIFSKKIIKIISKSFAGNIDIINIKDINLLRPKEYDLILSPLSLQYLPTLKISISYFNDALKADGILLANGYNILQSADTILEFKTLLQQNSLRPSLLNVFSLGMLCNEFSFKDKALDRDNLEIYGNKVELINLYCCKKGDLNGSDCVKVVIN